MLKKIFKILFSVILLYFVIGNVVYSGVEMSTVTIGTPPIIEKVKIDPEEPKDGEEIKISAIVYNDPKRTDDTVELVWLFYSTDQGKEWTKVDLEQAEGDKKLWQGIIPPQKENTNVLFYLQAEDTSGNIASEMPQILREIKDKEIPGDNELALICTDENVKMEVLADEFDILKIFAGSDEKNLYFKIETEGKIVTEDKPFVHNLVQFFNITMSKIEDEDRWRIVMGKYIWATYLLQYAPALKKAIGFTPFAARIGTFGAGGWIGWADWKEVGYLVKDNVLYLKVNRKIMEGLRKEKIENLKIFVISGSFPIYDLTAWGEYQDISNFVHLYLRNYSFKVK